MKVAIFVTNNLTKHNPAHSAANLLVIEPLKHLIKYKNLEITLFAPGNTPEDLTNGLRHVRYTLYNKPIFSFLSAFSAIPKLLREDYDLYHSFGQKATFIVSLAKKMKKIKSPILHVGFEITRVSKLLSKKSLKYKILEYFSEFRLNFALKHSEGLVIPSEGYKKYILKHNIYKKKIFVIQYVADLEHFGIKYEKKLTFVEKLGLADKKVIMYTGSISIAHGVLNLVKAMKIINRNVSDAVLVIVGDGDRVPVIKEYINRNNINNIIFVGYVARENIPKYHSIADVLVIPHIKRLDSELVYPSKLLEYLASGKPIVASNLKAIADVVGDNAILAEPENPQSFADGIFTLLNNEELAKGMGENGKKIIYNYSWEETAKKTYEAYKNLLLSFKNQSNRGGSK